MTTHSTTHSKEVIESRHHPAVKRARALQNRIERDRTGLFFCEGLRFVAQAFEHNFAPQALFYAPDLLTHPFGKRIIERRRAKTPCYALSSEVFQSLTLSDEPQGIAAICRQQWKTLDALDPKSALCWLALETVQSPGNLGTMLRTSDGVGAGGCLLLGDAVDPYHPACVRASMAALFTQSFARTTLEEFSAWKKRHGVRVVGTSPRAKTAFDAPVYRAPLVLFMGGERKGLTLPAMRLCDELVRIPMCGRGDSLNLAVATGLMLYEAFRQKN